MAQNQGPRSKARTGKAVSEATSAERQTSPWSPFVQVRRTVAGKARRKVWALRDHQESPTYSAEKQSQAAGASAMPTYWTRAARSLASCPVRVISAAYATVQSATAPVKATNQLAPVSDRWLSPVTMRARSTRALR